MARRYIFGGKELTPSWRGQKSEVITWLDEGGIKDLMEAGKYTEHDTREPTLVVVHWGVRSPRTVTDVLVDRGFSTHFAVEGDKIYQLVDLAYDAWHAHPTNRVSIGIDITERPEVKFLEHQLGEGDDVEVIDNPSPRGPDGGWGGADEVLSLDPVTAETVRELILDMGDLFDIPIEAPLDENGDWEWGVLPDNGKNFHGVIGHFHVSPKKWDAAPWWPQIMEPLLRPWYHPKRLLKYAGLGLGIGLVGYALTQAYKALR